MASRKVRERLGENFGRSGGGGSGGSGGGGSYTMTIRAGTKGEQKLTLYNTIPKGWKPVNTGSPLGGFTTISDGVSPLRGGKIAYVRKRGNTTPLRDTKFKSAKFS